MIAMLTVTCACGKVVHGSAAMAGQSVECMKCGRRVAFPAPVQPAYAAVGVGTSDLGLPAADDGGVADGSVPVPPVRPAAPRASAEPEACPADNAAPKRLPCELYYWVFLLALAPLGIALMDRGDTNLKQRLDRTLKANPHLKPRVQEILEDEDGTLDELLRALPGRRIDDQAYLPRESQQHLLFAGWSVAGFFILGMLLARKATSPWFLPLIGLFTATFGIAFLLVFQDFIGHSYELSLDPDRTFLTNLFGFVFVVGLGEELAKALPVLFYVRMFKNATWRGACLWGLASGIGFGVGEGILYSTERYHGIVGPEVYLTRFIACVALHGLWSASVGITVFHQRRLVNRFLGAVMYERWNWSSVYGPLLQVLGIAMTLHGLYDTFLTQDMLPLALLVALFSFIWMGWQIESSRENEIAAQARLRAAHSAP
jgi:RsiW-degrading membrane proteinase PrsW (M82 family)